MPAYMQIALTDLEFLLRLTQYYKKIHFFIQFKDHDSGRKQKN